MKSTKTLHKTMAFFLAVVMIISLFPTMPAFAADPTLKVVTLDGNAADTNPANTFKGYGTVSGNNTSRLLLDYKEEHPTQYWEVMNQLFNQDSGAGINHIKIEMGNDSNTSSGTEPATKRSEDEAANVRRGAGFVFAADAKTINPNVKVSILRWTQPGWVQPWSDGVTNSALPATVAAYERMYKWYKDTTIAVHETYGYYLDYINPDRNETSTPNVSFVKWFAKRMKSDVDFPNYDKIKIVASDENTTLNIPNNMLADAELMNAVDVMSYHYNMATSANYLKVNAENQKEIWYSEGVAPQTPAKYRANSDEVFGGVGSALDIAGRFIGMYTQGKRTHYMFQPAVGSFYSGAPYSTKEIITARDPWSGYYAPDVGINTVMHFTQFAAKDWMYLPDASFAAIGNRGNSEMDGNFAEAEYNRLALVSPDKKDFSVVMVNDSDREANFQFDVKKNIEHAGNPVQVWETRGSNTGQEYDANWYKKLGDISATENGDAYTYTLKVKPHSMVSLTSTVNNPNTGNARTPYVRNNNIPAQTVLDVESSNPAILYEDDFEYSDYSEVNGLSYLERRGGTPRYTADQGGAFEVYDGIGKDGSNGMKQMIYTGNKPGTWATTPFSYTVLGDESWANYETSIDFKMDLDSTHTGENYIAVGLRHKLNGTTSDSESGYKLRVYADGTWRLIRLTATVATGTINNFDASVWHHISIKATEKFITAALDGKVITSYTDNASGSPLSGQIMIQSSLRQSIFDNLKVEAVNGYAPYATERVDDLDSRVVYHEGSLPWGHSLSGGAGRINRTITTSGTNVLQSNTTKIEGTPNRWYLVRNEGNLAAWSTNASNAWAGENGSYASFTFSGTSVEIYGIGQGTSSVVRMDVYLDDFGKGYSHDTSKKKVSSKAFSNGTTSQLIYQVSGLQPGLHNVKIVKTAAASGSGNILSIEKAVVAADITTPTYLELPFTGTGFNLVGDTGSGTVDIYVDNALVDPNVAISAATINRTDIYSHRGLTNGNHTLKVVVKSGSFYIDSIDIMGAVYGTVSKAALTSLIAQVSGYKEEDYMLAEWTPFSNSLAAAQATLTNGTATQYAVDLALNTLQSAMDALRLKTQPVTVTGPYSTIVATKVGAVVAGLPESIKVTLADGTTGVNANINWINNTASRFATPYSMVQVKGEVVGGKNLFINVQVEVVPNDLVYFLDPGILGDVTPSFTAIKSFVGEGLLNDKADQPSTSNAVWGHTPTDANYKLKAISGSVVTTDKSQTGVYGSDTRNNPLVYILPLTVGKYTITSFHRDWFNNTSRTMDISLSYNDSEGNPITVPVRSALIAGPDGASVSYDFTLLADSTVKYTVNNTYTGNQAALISYLGVAKRVVSPADQQAVNEAKSIIEAATYNLYAMNANTETDVKVWLTQTIHGLNNLSATGVTVGEIKVSSFQAAAEETDGSFAFTVALTKGNAEALSVSNGIIKALDTTKPVISLTGDAIVTLSNGANYLDAGATASDDPDGDVSGRIVTTISNNMNSETTLNTAVAGTYTYHYNVSDAAGNMAIEVTRTVIVAIAPDVTKPIITLKGDAVINLVIGSIYVDAGATAVDNRDGDISGSIVSTISNNLNSETTLNTVVEATYTYHYNVSDAAGNVAVEVTRTVIVSVDPDVTKPIITLTGEATINLANGSSYTDAGAKATDDRDGDLSGSVVTTISNNVNSETILNTAVAGTYTYYYNVSDAAGNAAIEVTRTVRVAVAPDVTKPIITLRGEATVSLVNGASYVDAGATAADDRDGDVTGSVVTTISNNVNSETTLNTAVAGTYTYHYNVGDAAGNAAMEVTRTVVVEDRILTPTSNPTSPTVPTPAPTVTSTPTPTVAPTSTPVATSIQVLSEEDLKAAVAGTITVQISDDKNSVRLPTNIAESVGDNTLRLVQKNLTIEFSKQELKNIQGVVTGAQAEGAQINLSTVVVSKDVITNLINNTAINGSVNLATASDVYNFNLNVVTADGTEVPVTTFTEPLILTFKVNPNANPNLLGVYNIASDGTIQFVGGTLVDEIMTVKVNSSSQYAVLEYNKTFTDVGTSLWASEVIKKMAAKHIIEGVTDTSFNPQGNVTRAQFAAMIARTLGLKAVSSLKFKDIDPNEWYAEVVAAVSEAGIVLGRSSDTFMPNAAITREEMAVMSVRAYEYLKGKKITVTNPNSFSDHTQINAWAQNAVSIAQEAGFIKGRSNNQFAPQEKMTRAESAQVISNLMD